MLAIQPGQPQPQPQTQPQPQQETKLPIGYKPAMMKSPYEANLDKGFDDDEIETMMKYKLIPPSSVFHRIQDGSLNFDDYDEYVGKTIQAIG